MHRARASRETGYERHYGDMHAAMRGQGITSTSGRDASARAVEAGARLVSAPAGATFCVLQMPRGNLEVVSPRALVLAAVAEAILVCLKRLFSGLPKWHERTGDRDACNKPQLIAGPHSALREAILTAQSLRSICSGARRLLRRQHKNGMMWACHCRIITLERPGAWLPRIEWT